MANSGAFAGRSASGDRFFRAVWNEDVREPWPLTSSTAYQSICTLNRANRGCRTDDGVQNVVFVGLNVLL
jgi:hypothetical protein